MKKKLNPWQAFKTNHKELTSEEMQKALYMYAFLNPITWSLCVIVALLVYLLK